MVYFNRKVQIIMNIRDVTKTLKRGTGSGERGTEVWERVVSGNLHKNPKSRSKNEREKEEDKERNSCLG